MITQGEFWPETVMVTHKIYVASSWHNKQQQHIVSLLKDNGHDVYDFHNPRPGNKGFAWQEISKEWQQWDVGKYKDALWHPLSEEHFRFDIEALNWADVTILLLPSGRSAHTEAAWHRGRGKPVIIHMPELCEPELMYKMFNVITEADDELVEVLNRPIQQLERRVLTSLWSYRC